MASVSNVLHGTVDYIGSPPDKTYKRDITSAEEKLSLKDYPSILSDRELFLSIFYRACSSLEHVQKNRCFGILRKGTTITLVGKDHNIEDFEKCVEQIRVLIEKNKRENIACTILPIKIGGDIFIRIRSVEQIVFTHCQSPTSGRIYQHIYEEYILPSMPAVAESLGAIFSDATVEQRYKTDYYPFGENDTAEYSKKINGFTIEFLENIASEPLPK